MYAFTIVATACALAVLTTPPTSPRRRAHPLPRVPAGTGPTPTSAPMPTASVSPGPAPFIPAQHGPAPFIPAPRRSPESC